MSKTQKFMNFCTEHGGLVSGLLIGLSGVLIGISSDFMYDAFKKEQNVADVAKYRSNLLEDMVVLTRTSLAKHEPVVEIENVKGEKCDLRDTLKWMSKNAGVKIPSIGDDWDIPAGASTRTIREHKAGDMSAYETA